MDLLEKAEASRKLEASAPTPKKDKKKSAWNAPEKKEPAIEEEPTENFEIQIVKDYQDIQEFKEYQYIPSKQAINESIDMFRYVMRSIIKESDYHYIKQNKYLKRSGFRKIAQAFGITLEQVGDEEIFERGKETYARVKVRASLGHVDHKAIEIGMRTLIESENVNPNDIGSLLEKLSKIRHADGIGIVGLSEIKFEGNQTLHNLVGYAYTRAASRAIADLVGFGVVSATEMDVNQEKSEWLT